MMVVVALDAPPALTQVAHRFAATSRGIVAFRLHRVFDVHAGFSSRHEDLVLNGILQNGRVVRVHIVSYSINGKPADDATQAALENQYEHPAPDTVFQLPFDPRYLREYHYQSMQPGTIAFTSTLRDATHGDGTFSYDGANNVVSYSYQPGALPRYAKSGLIADHRAEVLPGYWAVIQETQQYKGAYGPFPGAATVQITWSNFRRFSDLQSAAAAL
jgi:hypothetical protein